MWGGKYFPPHHSGNLQNLHMSALVEANGPLQVVAVPMVGARSREVAEAAKVSRLASVQWCDASLGTGACGLVPAHSIPSLAGMAAVGSEFQKRGKV